MKLTVVLMAFVFILSAGAETWKSIESDHYVIMFGESESTARDIQRIAEDFHLKITKDLGYSPEKKIVIWFYESQKEFKLASNAPIQDWAAGYAYPLSARIVIRNPASLKDKKLNLSRLVKHEITHVVFGLYVGRNLRYVPAWFNEGLAMYEAEQWSYGQYWIMLTGALSDSLFPLYELGNEFPVGESQARMAYAQSCSIVNFLVREYGEDSFRECISLLAEGRGIDEALAGAIGIDSYWLEKKWLKSIKKRYKWISLVSSWVVLWTFVVLIALLAYWRRKVRNRRIIKRWEEEELWWNFEEDEDSEVEDWTY
jgi:hypothetical protein